MTRIALLLVAALCCPATGAAEGFVDAEAGVLYNSNLGNAQFSPDVKSDNAFTAAASAGTVSYFGDDISVTIAADARSELYDRFSGMNNIALGASLSARRKMGLGPTAPWISVTGSAARLQYQNDVRDGWLYRLGAAAGKRLGERWNVRADFTIERRTADQSVPSGEDLPGSVFDLGNRELALKADYALSGKMLLTGAYTRRVGEVVSTTSLETGIDEFSSAETRDTVFGPSAIAYRLRAASNIFSLGLSWTIGPHAWLNVNGQRQLTYAAGDNNYNKSVVTAAYAYSF